jgi:four helix bundle protein
MRDVKKYEVFNRSHELVKRIYTITKNYPKDEIYGLTSQMRRAVVSIVANMMEGSVKGHKEFVHYLFISLGSLKEMEYYIYLSKDLKLINENEYSDLNDELTAIRSMLIKLIKTVEEDAK